MVDELLVGGGLSRLRLGEDFAVIRPSIEGGVRDGGGQRHFRLEFQRHGKFVAQQRESPRVGPAADIGRERVSEFKDRL